MTFEKNSAAHELHKNADVRQAIETCYHGPTNTRGSRISAKCSAGRVSISYPSDLNHVQTHAAAAAQLATKLGWAGAWSQGGTTGAGYVFIASDAPAFTVTEAAP